MWYSACIMAFGAASFLLGGCASPYFIHDPQTLVIDREEVPRLLKSLRCELATFVAANNQRHMMFDAESKTRGIKSAAAKYQYFELDPTQFGGVALDLRIQDSAGLQNGTQFDWMRTDDGGAHAHAWNLGPTLSDQSTYEANWGFVVPQDTISLPRSSSKIGADLHVNSIESSFPCYSEIPQREPPPFASRYAEADFDALALGTYPDYARFKRVMVNGATPLAGWLVDVAKSITESTFYWEQSDEMHEHIVPAQMIYTFTVQVSGGLDVKYNLASPLWPAVAAEVSGGMQKTNTITITLNGLEAAAFANVALGNDTNTEANKLPTIPVSGSSGPLPSYVGRKGPRGRVLYPVIIKHVISPKT